MITVSGFVVGSKVYFAYAQGHFAKAWNKTPQTAVLFKGTCASFVLDLKTVTRNLGFPKE